MKFQIFSTRDNKAVVLDEFDKMYCEETDIEYSEDHYADWYIWLEGVLRTYEGIAKTKDSDLYFSVVQGNDRRVDFLGAAKCLMIYAGTLMYDYKTADRISGTIDRTKSFRDFLINHKHDFYFEFFY